MKNTIKVTKMYLIACILLVSCHDDDPLDSNNPLQANAGLDKQVIVGNSVTLDGSHSINNSNEEFQFEWTIKSKPTSSEAVLTNQNQYNPSFLADAVGVYTIELKITDHPWVSSDEVLVVASEAGTQAVLISEDITENIVLNNVFMDDYELVDYLITKPIQLQAKLTIMPGVRVAFAEDASLKITKEGVFVSEGGSTEEDRIYLTGQEHNPGYWSGIYINSNHASNLWKHTELSFAGGESDWSLEGVGLYLDDNSSMVIDHSFFVENFGVQVYYSDLAEFIAFTNNYLLGIENNPHSLAIPISQVTHLGTSNQIWNGDIALTTSVLESGENIIWPSYLYSALNGIKLLNGTTLNIPEYTQIRMAQNQRIDVLNGSRLIAEGSLSGTISFSGIENTPGYWKGIYIEHSNLHQSVLEYVLVKNAGSAPLSGNQAASLHLGPYGMASINYSSFNDGAGDGIEATSEGATIITFIENAIRGHQGYPIAVSTKNVAVLDVLTLFTNNGKSQIRVDGNYPIAFDGEVVWRGFQQTNMSYHIDGLGKDLTIWSGLRLMPSVVLEMEDNARIVVETANGNEGYIKALGTDSRPIIIKHRLGIPGSWYGITISNTHMNNYLNYVIVLHGGKPVANSFSANIMVDNSPEGRLSILNSTIGYSGQHGISILNQSRENLKDTNIVYLEIPGDQVYAW